MHQHIMITVVPKKIRLLVNKKQLVMRYKDVAQFLKHSLFTKVSSKASVCFYQRRRKKFR